MIFRLSVASYVYCVGRFVRYCCGIRFIHEWECSAFVSILHICSEMHAVCCDYVMYGCVCRSNATLLNLVLAGNAIMHESAALLAAALRCDVKPPDVCLVSLFFDAARLFCSHHSSLSYSVNRTLQVLDLTSTRLTAAGATSLAETLRCVLMCLVTVLYGIETECCIVCVLCRMFLMLLWN